MRHTRARLALAVLLLLSGAAVEGAPSELRLLASTKRVVYYAAHKGDLDVKRTEAFLARLETLFGVIAGNRIEYHRHSSRAALEELFGIGISGAMNQQTGRIDSLYAYHPHELVHAAAGRLGRVPTFFAEGLAVALTSAGRWRGRDLDLFARDALHGRRLLDRHLDEFGMDDPEADYAIAGSFVSFLLERHGIDAFVHFLRSCPPAPPRDRPEAAFRSAFGLALADAAFEWEREIATRERPVARLWHDAATWPESLKAPGALAAPAGDPRAAGTPGRALGAATAGLGRGSVARRAAASPADPRDPSELLADRRPCLLSACQDTLRLPPPEHGPDSP